ncbi:MAG: hypothetical protein WCA46_22625 [Actinocatenispora sp.]
MDPVRALRQWPLRRWLFAAGSAVAVVVVIGIPTAVVPNPLFARMTPTTWWNWPVLAVTAILGGLVAATYVRAPGADTRGSRTGTIGGVLSWLAVGCPVCNKLVVLAVGMSGALRWFAPIQPLLAVASVVLLGYALVRRLRGEISCPVPDPVA